MGGRRGRLIADENFGWGEAGELLLRLIQRHFGRGKGAGSNVRVSNARAFLVGDECGEIIVSLCFEQIRLDDRPRCDNPNYFARF